MRIVLTGRFCSIPSCACICFQAPSAEWDTLQPGLDPCALTGSVPAHLGTAKQIWIQTLTAAVTGGHCSSYLQCEQVSRTEGHAASRDKPQLLARGYLHQKTGQSRASVIVTTPLPCCLAFSVLQLLQSLCMMRYFGNTDYR